MVSLSGRPLQYRALLGRMGTLLEHRGPDDTGTIDCEHAALGAERLRIVDRRVRANQPFAPPSRASWLVCNGEIYNAAALRARFRQYPYRSRCDVEPLVPLLCAEGPSGLDAADGMFALAWWSPASRTLLLARDRAGEKPLFYTERSGELWFASEIQALLIHPDFSRELDALALSEFLALGYVREPRTMFRSIRKVPAGVSLTFGPDGSLTRHTIATPIVAVPPSMPAARRVLRGLLEDAVSKQMTADVPVGVFASGGVDSALITALAQRHAVGGGGLTTFTASFDNSAYDEGPAASRIATALRTRHVEIEVGERQLAEALQVLVQGMAEPLADPALLPTYLVSREAKNHVGVVLTGEGADELFGGYPTYIGHRAAAAVHGLPEWFHRALQTATSRTAATHRPNTLPFLLQRLVAHAGEGWRQRHVAWFGTGWLPHLEADRAAEVIEALPRIEEADAVAGARALDFQTYLRDGLLVKLDRASMLVSLETRSPFLDPYVRGFAAGLPPQFVIDGWRTKPLLKAVAAEILPPWVVRRRKRGLSVPIASWINQGLREEVDRLLDPRKIVSQGVLPTLPIRQLLEEHRRGEANHARSLWPLIVLQYWLEHWVLE